MRLSVPGTPLSRIPLLSFPHRVFIARPVGPHHIVQRYLAKHERFQLV